MRKQEKGKVSEARAKGTKYRERGGGGGGTKETRKKKECNLRNLSMPMFARFRSRFGNDLARLVLDEDVVAFGERRGLGGGGEGGI